MDFHREPKIEKDCKGLLIRLTQTQIKWNMISYCSKRESFNWKFDEDIEKVIRSVFNIKICPGDLVRISETEIVTDKHFEDKWPRNDILVFTRFGLGEGILYYEFLQDTRKLKIPFGTVSYHDETLMITYNRKHTFTPINESEENGSSSAF